MAFGMAALSGNVAKYTPSYFYHHPLDVPQPFQSTFLDCHFPANLPSVLSARTISFYIVERKILWSDKTKMVKIMEKYSQLESLGTKVNGRKSSSSYAVNKL